MKRISTASCGVRELLPGLVALGLGLALAVPPPATAAALRVLAEQELPAVLLRARDVRWAGEDSVFLVAVEAGAFRVSLGDTEPRLESLIAGGKGLKQVWLSSRVAATPQFLVVAGPIWEVAWKDRGGGELRREVAFDFIEDMDASGGKVLVLGAQRGEDGTFAPDGGVAWLGSLERGLSDFEAVQYSTAGPGAQPMAFCGNFEIGQVRFLTDGSFVVVPGFEPGVFLFDHTGRLRHTWETEPLGLEARCDFSDEKHVVYARDPEARWAWINQFDIVDDILPLPQGPALVIRSVSREGTRWRLVALRRDGAPLTWEVPISTPTTMTHLRGDLRGQRLVFLVFEEGRPGSPDAVSPRLVITEVPK